MRVLAIIIMACMVIPQLRLDTEGAIDAPSEWRPPAGAPTMEDVTNRINNDLRRITKIHNLPGLTLTSEEAAYIKSRQKEVPKIEEFSESWEKEVRHNISKPSAPRPMIPEEINNYDGNLLKIDGEIYNMDEYLRWRYESKRSGRINFWRGEIIDKEEKQLRFVEFLVTIAMAVGAVWFTVTAR